MSINIYSAAGLFKEFLDTDIVSGTTINFIKEPKLGPLSYPAVLLIIAGVAFIILLIYYRSLERSLSRRSVVRASLLSFMLAGFLFALRMDLNWLSMFNHDLRTYTGKDIGARVVELKKRDLYYFIDFVRNSIPEGEMAREIEIDRKEYGHFISKIGKYYLLPTRTSPSGRYLWVNKFILGTYDPETRDLEVYGYKFKAVPHAVYDESSVVFRIIEE